MTVVWAKRGLEIVAAGARDRSGQPPSKVESRGSAAIYDVVDSSGWRLTVLDTMWQNGERDVSCYEFSNDTPEAVRRLKHGLRLAVYDVLRPASRGGLWVELRQARVEVKDGLPWSNLCSARLDQLDAGAGCDVAAELKALGASVGTRADLLGDAGRHRLYLCAVFPSQPTHVPVVAWSLSRVLPLRGGYTGK